MSGCYAFLDNVGQSVRCPRNLQPSTTQWKPGIYSFRLMFQSNAWHSVVLFDLCQELWLRPAILGCHRGTVQVFAVEPRLKGRWKCLPLILFIFLQKPRNIQLRGCSAVQFCHTNMFRSLLWPSSGCRTVRTQAIRCYRTTPWRWSKDWP